MRYIISNAEKQEHKLGFTEELRGQANFMVRPLAILACFAWLGFAFVADPRLHPELPELVLYRLGLSFVGITVLITSFFKAKENRSSELVHLMYGYCLFSTSWFTGHIANDASYISGLQLVILVAPIFPFRLWQLWAYLLVSIILFLSVYVHL